MPDQPHIVIIIPRGEAVRNFLYSDTLRILHEHSRITLLSVIHDDEFHNSFSSYVDRIVALKSFEESGIVRYLRRLLYESHFLWLGSVVSRKRWEIWFHRSVSNNGWDPRRRQAPPHAVLRLQKILFSIFAHRPALYALSTLDRFLTHLLLPSNELPELFRELKPDLVFNTSHIHGVAGELPARVAGKLGIPVVGFIFSWDNLTTRGRIFVPYDHYLVWHQPMHDLLMDIYSHIKEDDVTITGTPQFDYHFKPDYWLTREELAARIGFDPERPFILYTTGMASDFPGEHRTVELVIQLLDELDFDPKPQLVVRTYVKGTSEEMKALAARNLPDVYFPPVQWDEKWYVPAYEDLATYTSLLRECCMGINAASTVTLELLMHEKPVINLGFDPPGVTLPNPYRFELHLLLDHYLPVAESGAVMVARSPEDMREMLRRGLETPDDQKAARQQFIDQVFGDTLDGRSGQRVAEKLLDLARQGAAAGK